MELRGWEQADVILFSADAYVDHPAFGASVIGRLLEAEGLRVAIVPQPDWHGDFRDFKKLGRPRLFFGISPGAMDSMVNKYTAARRLRSEDAYSPDGRHDLRPEYPTIVYTDILRKLFPDVPIVLGGIEASLRRVMHYDYWQERFRPSILCDCDADLITYGMGEKVNLELVRLLVEAINDAHPLLHYDENGEPCITRGLLRDVTKELPQTVSLCKKEEIPGGIKADDIVLHSYEDCLKQPKLHAENFRHIEEESNKMHAQRLLQQTGNKWVVVNPPYPPLSSDELDKSFDLPYTRLPHPKYKGKRIPAYEMIKFSVTLHRGCFGGCAFCTISAHQGKFIVSRSKESILREVKAITKMPDFKGYLSDLGGPSANMYQMRGKNQEVCEKCKRPSCIHPAICPNMNGDHRPLLDIYRSVDALPGIKKSFIGSGVRYDMLLHDWKDEALNRAARDYTQELITKHVSGRLKVAPEHTSDKVLNLMRKPSFSLFRQFKSIFDTTCRKAGLRQQLIPYFISSHPGCTARDMAELAAITKQMDFKLEQVQDFTPTPLTMATTCWATGYHPYTLEPVFSAKSPKEKREQNMYFFWYKNENRNDYRKNKRN
ncbi:MAG: YgiQ family radical SAM protein [Bacteroidaceae bacterium]|nr:YgiQ family radical SAM protein [Bacteroidaceae bacterium]